MLNYIDRILADININTMLNMPIINATIDPNKTKLLNTFLDFFDKSKYVIIRKIEIIDDKIQTIPTKKSHIVVNSMILTSKKF